MVRFLLTTLLAVRMRFLVFFVCLVAAGSAPNLLPQAGSMIEGIALDAIDRGVLHDVEVSIVGSEHARIVFTDSAGRYRISALPAGTYTLSASLDGFASRVIEDLVVLLNQTLTYDITLEAGSETDVTEPAVSSDDERDHQREIPEVVVTARRREESMQDVPSAMSAFDTDSIARLGAQLVSDLQYAVPNFRMSEIRSSFVTIEIRGIQGFSRNIGTDGRASVYVDGVFVGRSQAVDQELLDLERVEVLRGPQGTMFGKNTVSGAISLITRKPTQELGGTLAATIGNFNQLDLRAIVNLPLTDKLFAKVSASRVEKDGYINNELLSRDLNGNQSRSGRLQLRYLASDALDINFSADHLTQDVPATNAVQFGTNPLPPGLSAPPRGTVRHDADENSARDLSGGSITVDYRLPGGYTLTSITAYREADFQQITEEDYTPFFIAASNFDEESEQFTQELRITSADGGRYDFVAGLYYFNGDASTGRSVDGDPVFYPVPDPAEIPHPVIQTSGTTNTESTAAFLHGNYRLTDSVELTAGLRFTHETKDIRYRIQDFTELFFLNLAEDFVDDRSDSEFSPLGGINYYINDDVMLYASVARAFKSGGWNADFIATLEQIEFRPEFATSYEIGLKSDWLDNRLRLNAAAFQTDIDDFQVFQFVQSSEGTVIVLTNAGEVRTKGLELELTALPLADLSVRAALGLLDTQYLSFKDGGGPGIDLDGQPLGAADITGGIGLDYFLPMGSAGSLLLHGDYSYRGDTGTRKNPQPVDTSKPAYGLLNAQLGFESAGGVWEVLLWGQNIADETYLLSKDESFLRVPRVFYGEPRTYGVTVKRHF